MTQTSNPAAVKWAPGWNIRVGIYPYEVDPTWFRPHQTCKMRILGHDYCSVCTEAIVERIHDLVNPLLGYEPQNLTLEVGNEPIEFSVSYLEPFAEFHEYHMAGERKNICDQRGVDQGSGIII